MKQAFSCWTCGAEVLREPCHVVGRVFCSRACCNTAKKGEPSKRRPMIGPDHPKWKGGRMIQNGYRYLWMPEHPNALPKGYVAEHRKVMADHLGRALTTAEDVHHVNGNKLDNRIANLKILTRRAHAVLTQSELGDGWSRRKDSCADCGTTVIRHYAKGLCTRCYHRRWMERLRREGYIAPCRRKTKQTPL